MGKILLSQKTKDRAALVCFGLLVVWIVLFNLAIFGGESPNYLFLGLSGVIPVSILIFLVLVKTERKSS